MTTYRRAAILIAVDSLSWFLAVIAAVLLRYDLSLSGLTPKSIIGVAGVAAVLFVLSGFAFSIYSGRHRLGSYQEILTLGLAVWPPAIILFVWLAVSDPRPVALSVPLIALPSRSCRCWRRAPSCGPSGTDVASPRRIRHQRSSSGRGKPPSSWCAR